MTQRITQPVSCVSGILQILCQIDQAPPGHDSLLAGQIEQIEAVFHTDSTFSTK